MLTDNNKSKSGIDFSIMRKVLIIRLGKIGDIVVTSFVFETIKSNYPHIDIYILTLKSNMDVLEFNPRIKKGFYSGNNLMLLWNLVKLKFLNFDLILDFNDNSSTTSSLILRFLSSKFKAAYNYDIYKNITNIKIRPLEKTESHIIERTRNYLNQMGIAINEKDVKPFFYLDPVALKEIKHQKWDNKKIITLNLSAGAEIRYWEKDKWIELIKLILKVRPGFGILLLSTAKDEPLRKYIQTNIIESISPSVKNLTIQQFASYIKISAVLITPDTSAVHIASAFGIPTIAMYPNFESNFISWQPYKIPYRSIKSSAESIKDIAVKEVYSAFQSLINEIRL